MTDVIYGEKLGASAHRAVQCIVELKIKIEQWEWIWARDGSGSGVVGITFTNSEDAAAFKLKYHHD
jgi:hypothetical protein